jgi:hypothetical protein
MKIQTNVALTVYEIVWNSGKIEYMVLNGVQLAGFKRRKGIKKQYITLKPMVNIALQIKTAI